MTRYLHIIPHLLHIPQSRNVLSSLVHLHPLMRALGSLQMENLRFVSIVDNYRQQLQTLELIGTLSAVFDLSEW